MWQTNADGGNLLSKRDRNGFIGVCWPFLRETLHPRRHPVSQFLVTWLVLDESGLVWCAASRQEGRRDRLYRGVHATGGGERGVVRGGRERGEEAAQTPRTSAVQQRPCSLSHDLQQESMRRTLSCTNTQRTDWRYQLSPSNAELGGEGFFLVLCVSINVR